MHRLELAHNTDNISSQKIIERLGAKFEGIARESKFYNNGFKDRKIYSILKQEWVQKNKMNRVGRADREHSPRMAYSLRKRHTESLLKQSG